MTFETAHLVGILLRIRAPPFGSSSPYLNFGHAPRHTGRFKEAISAYKKSVQRAPFPADPVERLRWAIHAYG
jgi:hypothetical protein